MKKNFSFSVCIPVYKGSSVLERALNSVFGQAFTNYEVIMCDDNPLHARDETEKTQAIIKKWNSRKIRYIKNSLNLGSAKTIKKLASLAKNDVIFFLCQDDILAKDALQKTHDAFLLDPSVGAVTRPYFWYDDDIRKPVRAVLPYNKNKDTVLSIFDGKKEIIKIFESLGQASGLAYRRDRISIPFGEDIFPGHIYPFAGILKKYTCVFLKDFTVAVAIKTSQSRHVSSVYSSSPTESWMRMFLSVFPEEKYRFVRETGMDYMATHFTGLVQLKNFAPAGVLEKEIMIHLKYHWQSIFAPKFWFYCIVTIFIPSFMLITITDWYKRNVLSKSLPRIRFHK